MSDKFLKKTYQMSGLHRTGVNGKELVRKSLSFYFFLDKPKGEEHLF